MFNMPATEQYSKTGESATSGFVSRLFSAVQSTKGDATWQKRMLWYYAILLILLMDLANVCDAGMSSAREIGRHLMRAWRGLIAGALRILSLVMETRLWGMGRRFLRRFLRGIWQGRSSDVDDGDVWGAIGFRMFILSDGRYIPVMSEYRL